MPFPLHGHDHIREHFRKKRIPWTDECLAGVLQNPQSSKWDVYYAVLALRDCGTLRSVDALKSVLHYPMQDVKCTAVLTIAHIARELETPLYASLLLDPTYREKAYAMWAIQDAADERALDAVLEYFKRNRSKLLRGALANETIPNGFEYLEKFINRDPRIAELFTDVLRFLPKLDKRNVDDLRKQVSFFQDTRCRTCGSRGLSGIVGAFLRVIRRSRNSSE